MVFTGFHVDRDPRQQFRAHRCQGSLANYMSIRYRKGDKDWQLSKFDFDFDYMVYYEYRIARIRYCPFCGKRLWPMSFSEMYTGKRGNGN